MPDHAGSAGLTRYVDLHSHTNESDGSLTPEELVQLGKRSDLDALSITDHDTFTGYEKAVPFARAVGLELLRGIELNARLNFGGAPERSVHLLGYFPQGDPSPGFIEFLEEQRRERRSRNRRLAAKLQERGVGVTVEEVENRGRSLAGRVHFARILIEKGYAKDTSDAFHRYLGDDAPTYVHRESHIIEEAIQIVRNGGGLPVLAHPVRLSVSRDEERELFAYLKDAGMAGLEIYHSEHSPALQAHYRQLAEELDLLPTGGSDFHGRPKPEIDLGTGLNGNVRVPREFLDNMRRCSQKL